jgi:hypothetical protein
MSSNSWLFTHDMQASPSAALALQRRADEIAAETFERAEKRRISFAELKSDLHSPAGRISAWEKLHGLRLPSDPRHAVLTLIAQSTGLTLAQVRDEQRIRSEQKAGTGARAQGLHGQSV